MKRLNALAVAFASFASAQVGASPQAEAQTANPFPPIVIVGFETFGAGCPPQSVAKPFSQGTAPGGRPGEATLGRQWIGLDLPDYFANVDEGKSIDGRSCEIRLHLEAEAGFRTIVNTVKFVGTTFLEQDVVAQLDASYLWSGKPIQSRSQTPHRFKGPREEPMLITDIVEGSQASFCNSRETFIIQSSINLTNSNPRRIGEFIVNQAQIEVGSSIRPNTAPPAGTPFGGVSVWIEASREPCSRRI